MTQAYPLAWPLGWPRTDDRQFGHFTSRSNSGWDKKVSLHQATSRVMDEIGRFTKRGKTWRIPPDSVVISTDLQVRKSDGLPKSGQRQPDDPGVAVYFELDGKPQVIPCDRYTKIEQNLAAVAATLAALRTLERHGSGIMERAFTGFQALPHLAKDPWYVVLGVPENAPHDVVQKQYRLLRSTYHTDNAESGDADQFGRVMDAWNEYQQKELSQ